MPNSVHEARPWVISQIAHDFKLLDVWALPAEGGPDDFTTFLEVMASLDPAEAGLPNRALFWLLLRLGALLGLDDVATTYPIPGSDETTLRARLPDDLQGSADSPAIGGALLRAGAAFVPLFRTDDEWAAEISNRTVHGVLHFSWVDRGGGRFSGHLAVYVKARGGLGEAYMTLIDPFRQFIVYPALMRQIERVWAARPRSRSVTA